MLEAFAMTIINVSWYLCFLFVIALAVSSAISVVHGKESEMRLLMGTYLALSVLSAVVAIIFKRFSIRQPKWLLRLFQAFAVLATLVVLGLVGG